MDLVGWEYNTDGTPVNGATVQAYLSSGTNLVPPGGVVSSTTTSAQGYWTLTGLANSAHDVKITSGSKIKWYKGLSAFSVKSIIGDNFTPPDINLLRNGGFESWRQSTSTSISGATSTQVAEAWTALGTASDTLVISREATIISSTGSKYALKAVYTKVGAGPAVVKYVFSNELLQQLRGRSLYVSFQLRQGVSSNCTPYITDSAGTTNGSASATTGSYVTLTVNRTVDSSATSLEVGIKIAASDTAYLDNVIAVVSAVAPTFNPRMYDTAQIRLNDLADEAKPSYLRPFFFME